MDQVLLAQAAVAFIVPWLQQTGSKALEKVQGNVADVTAAAPGKLYGWLKEKLAPHAVASAALDELPSNPCDEIAQKAIEAQLAKIIKDNEALRLELQQLLPVSQKVEVGQSASQSGIGNKVAQVAGSGNTTTIS